MTKIENNLNVQKAFKNKFGGDSEKHEYTKTLTNKVLYNRKLQVFYSTTIKKLMKEKRRTFYASLN